MISSEMTLLTRQSHNGALFTCKMTSLGFTDFERTCHIGPISVMMSKDTLSSALIPSPTKSVTRHIERYMLVANLKSELWISFERGHF